MGARRGTGTAPAVLAVDGGNSKADAVLIDRSGKVLGAARRSGSSNVGLSRNSADVLTEAVRAASADAGLPADGQPIAPVGVYCLAGADLPVDDRRVSRALVKQGWSQRTIVHNDTFAVLRAGTDAGWGVAVVCGAGMNCLGLSPDGRVVRFPALGPLSGDWAAGGDWVGIAALGAAVRGRDGRGERTVLERLVPEHFGLARPGAVVEAIYLGRLEQSRLVELPPMVFEAAASGDLVARQILDQVADEIVAMAVATIRRLRVASREVEVILGGGMFRPDDRPFTERVRDGIAAVAPAAVVRRLGAPPVLGAALIGLDETGAPASAAARLRTALSFERLDGARFDGHARSTGRRGG